MARRRNVQMGYVDAGGIFHPIRASADYSYGAAGERKRSRKASKKKASKKHKVSASRKRKVSRKRKNPGVPSGWIKAKAVKVTRLPGGGVNVKVRQ